MWLPQSLQLSKAKVHNVVAQFPAVSHIDMSGRPTTALLVLVRYRTSAISSGVVHPSCILCSTFLSLHVLEIPVVSFELILLWYLVLSARGMNVLCEMMAGPSI